MPIIAIVRSGCKFVLPTCRVAVMAVNGWLLWAALLLFAVPFLSVAMRGWEGCVRGASRLRGLEGVRAWLSGLFRLMWACDLPKLRAQAVGPAPPFSF